MEPHRCPWAKGDNYIQYWLVYMLRCADVGVDPRGPRDFGLVNMLDSNSSELNT